MKNLVACEGDVERCRDLKVNHLTPLVKKFKLDKQFVRLLLPRKIIYIGDIFVLWFDQAYRGNYRGVICIQLFLY